jgi:ribosomal protein S24E
LDVDSKKQNKLMERTEVKFKVTHDGESTPARDAIRTALASALGVQKDRVIVSSMTTEYGIGDTYGAAKVYDTVEAAKKNEQHHLLIRNGLAQKEEKKAAAAAAKK